MKRIIYIDEPLNPPGGGQISLLTIIKNIDKEKYDFVVFLKKDYLFKDILEKNGVKVEFVKTYELFGKIKEFNPDIVHINSACTKYTFWGAFFSKILKKKVVWHNRVLESSPLKERVITFFVDRIIAISNEVAKKFRYADKKVVVLYNPVDLNNIRLEIKADELKERLNIPRDLKVIGVFSRLEKWKGHRILFEAISRLKYNVFLIVCGEGSEKNNLIEFAKTLNIYERIKFMGFVENVYDYINICDIVVNPSVEAEPFGRVIIEAMAMGKVVIATDMGGPSEIIIDGIDGILVKTNAESLKLAIEKVLSDGNLYKKISDNAKIKSFNFDVLNYIKKLEIIYEKDPF
ncbi:MAG: glycosyltransferase [Elusimicrobiota bacterium]